MKLVCRRISDQLPRYEAGLTIVKLGQFLLQRSNVCVFYRVTNSTYPFSSLETIFHLKLNQALHTKVVCVRAH